MPTPHLMLRATRASPLQERVAFKKFNCVVGALLRPFQLQKVRGLRYKIVVETQQLRHLGAWNKGVWHGGI